jgi:hypothetical protein
MVSGAKTKGKVVVAAAVMKAAHAVVAIETEARPVEAADPVLPVEESLLTEVAVVRDEDVQLEVVVPWRSPVMPWMLPGPWAACCRPQLAD